MESSGDILIDEWVPGAPLLITFAFVNWERPADFYLLGRSKKLEQLCGRRFNRILLRDRRNLWYLNGVPDLGGSVAETVDGLRRLIETMAPTEVWCVGESMGGYAALLYGILLGASRIVAFGPLSTFSPDFAAAYGDLRWRDVMTRLDPAPTVPTTDLPDLARRSGYAGTIHLIAGTSAGPQAPDTVNLDVMHAERFAGMPGVRRHYFPRAEHAVTQWLADNALFDDILLQCLIEDPAPLPSPSGSAVPADFDAPVLTGNTVGAPLLVVFADRETDDLLGGAFDEECALLGNLHGTAINRLVVRGSLDRDLSGGDALAADLQALIAPLEPRRVISIGSGLGGYAALAIGALLRADRLLAFDPPTIRDPTLAALWRDRRYRLDGGGDLLPLLAEYSGRIFIACGMAGTGSGPDVGSHAAIHAQRLAALPNVHVQPWPASGSVALWMREKKLLAGFLGYCGVTSQCCAVPVPEA